MVGAKDVWGKGYGTEVRWLHIRGLAYSKEFAVAAAGHGGPFFLSITHSGVARELAAALADVNRRWIGTPYRHPKGPPLSGEFGR